jgi:hypothetical protein
VPAEGGDPAAGIHSVDPCFADKKEFTEPVALSSTCHVDLPLARSASVTGFDLVALRARCTANLRPPGCEVKQVERGKRANCVVSVHGR